MIPQHVDVAYVARHLWRIENKFRNNPGMQADSRYRIANVAFNACYPLTDDDKARLKEFVADFYASSEGSSAIANKLNHW